MIETISPPATIYHFTFYFQNSLSYPITENMTRHKNLPVIAPGNVEQKPCGERISRAAAFLHLVAEQGAVGEGAEKLGCRSDAHRG